MRIKLLPPHSSMCDTNSHKVIARKNSFYFHSAYVIRSITFYFTFFPFRCRIIIIFWCNKNVVVFCFPNGHMIPAKAMLYIIIGYKYQQYACTLRNEMYINIVSISGFAQPIENVLYMVLIKYLYCSSSYNHLSYGIISHTTYISYRYRIPTIYE